MDWSGFISNSLSNILTGGLLIFVGYVVWKRQLKYQKKLDLYFKAVAITSFARDIIGDVVFGYQFEYYKARNTYISNIETFRELRKISAEFQLYFNNKYLDDFDLFYSTMITLIDRENVVVSTDIPDEFKQSELTYLKNGGKSKNEIRNDINTAVQNIKKIYDVNNKKFSKVSGKKGEKTHLRSLLAEMTTNNHDSK